MVMEPETCDPEIGARSLSVGAGFITVTVIEGLKSRVLPDAYAIAEIV